MRSPAYNPSSARLNLRFQPLSLIRMLWKQKALTLLAWLVLAGAGVLAVRLLPTLYTSEAVILVESQKIPDNLVASTVNAEIQDRLATIKEQILSSTRLQKIIDKFSLYTKERGDLTHAEVIDRMRKDIKITLERGWTRNQPGAFRISYTGPSPETVTSVANELSNLFIEENLRTRETQAMGTSEFLETQLKQAKKNLEQQEAKVAEYKQAHNGELPEQEQSLLSMLGNLKVQLLGSQEAINRAQQTKTMLEQEVASAETYRSALKGMAAEGAGPNRGGADPVGSGGGGSQPGLRRSDTLKRELADLLLRYTPNHPLVKETQAVLAQALKQEEDEQKRQMAQAAEDAKKRAKQDGPAVAPNIRPETAELLLREESRINSLKVQLQIATGEVEAKQAQQEDLVKTIASYQERLEKLPIRQQEMAGLLRDYDISRENYKSLLNKDFSAEMSSDMEKRQKAERFTILDPARLPEKPSKPNRPLLNSLAIAAGLLAALGIGLGREWKMDLLLGEWELPEGTAVLGCIPVMVVSSSGILSGAPPIQPSSRTARRQKSARRLRWALVSSIVLSVTILVVIGLWFGRG